MKSFRTHAAVVWTIALLFELGAPAAFAEDEYVFGADEYDDLKTAYQKLEEVPADSRAAPLIIGIGRSPGAIIGFGKARFGPNAAINLPYSGRAYPNGPRATSTQDTVAEADEPLSNEEKRNLFEAFDRFFPSPIEVGNRSIVLVDFSRRGDSLLSCDHYLAEYLSSRGRQHKIYLAAFGLEQDHPRIRINGQQRGRPIQVIGLPTNSRLLHAMNETLHKPYAEYDSYWAGEDPAELQPRLQYKIGIEAPLLKRIMNDRKLPPFVRHEARSRLVRLQLAIRADSAGHERMQQEQEADRAAQCLLEKFRTMSH